jgi:hypothetical protein
VHPSTNPILTHRSRTSGALALALLVSLTLLFACGYAGTPPNERQVKVSISPKTVTLGAGATQQFTATVSNTSNTAVIWQVNGITGGGPVTGTLSTAGLYTAPTTTPASSVTVTAVSVADSSVNASATVSFQSSPVTITLTPTSASVPESGVQQFTATISAATAIDLAWSVNGVAGGSAATGTITANSSTSAIYSAPSNLPAQNPVTISVANAANASESAAASVTITCSAPNTLSPQSASLGLGQTQSFTASLCLNSGASIVWDVNGIVGGNSSIGTISSTGAASASYTAPTSVPSSQITIHAVSGSASASASITIASGVTVAISPSSASIATSQQLTFTPTVTGSSDTNVTWTVNGVANGNATVGQICAASASPCTPPSGASPSSVIYVAPATVPLQNPVSVVATSAADSSRTAAAQIQITSSVTPSGPAAIAPQYLFIAATGGAPSTQQFYVQNPDGSSVPATWSVESAVPGSGCTGAACGSISSSGLFTAPGAAPSPNAIAVIATTQITPPVTLTAVIAVKTGPTIETVLPSSVTAGAVEGFPLEVQGLNFVAGSGSSASTILFNGAARATSCSSSGACATALNPSDVATAGTLTVQIENPNGALSNPAPFVVTAAPTSPTTIALSSGQTSASAISVVVTEPTTAAASTPINVNFIGPLLSANNCEIGAAPIVVTRPASGTQPTSICVQGNGLDATFTYSFGGPDSAPDGSDIPVTAAPVSGLLSNTIELTLEISSSTAPGLRTLLIRTLNGDQAAATGMLEVQ